MRTYVIKRGDTRPFEAVLQDRNGPVNLADVDTARFTMRQRKGSLVIEGAMIGSEYPLRYEWGEGETDTLGVYEAEIAVTYDDGTVQTFPNEGYQVVKIVEALTP